MNTLKTALAVIASCCISSLGLAEVRIHNNTGYYVHVTIPFIGAESPVEVDIPPSESRTEIKDIACYKTGVNAKAYVKSPELRGNEGPKATTDFGKGFGGSLADVDINTSTDPETETIILKITVEAR